MPAEEPPLERCSSLGLHPGVEPQAIDHSAPLPPCIGTLALVRPGLRRRWVFGAWSTQQAAHPEEGGGGAEALHAGDLECLGVEHDREREQEDAVADGAPDGRLDRVARPSLHVLSHRRLDALTDHAEWRCLDRELDDRADVVFQARMLLGLDQPGEHRLAGVEGALELGHPTRCRGRLCPVKVCQRSTATWTQRGSISRA